MSRICRGANHAQHKIKLRRYGLSDAISEMMTQTNYSRAPSQNALWPYHGINMNIINRIESNTRVSRVVTHNNVAYFSGLVALDFSEDIRGQTQQVLNRLEKYLQAAGTNRSHLLSVQLWVKDIAGDIAGLNEVWTEWFAEHEKPTRATCQVTFDDENIRLELVAVAAVPQLNN